MPEDITPERTPNQQQPIASQVNEVSEHLRATIAALREKRSDLSIPVPSEKLPEIFSGEEIDRRIEELERGTETGLPVQDTRVYMDDNAYLPQIPTLTDRMDLPEIPTLTERIDEGGMGPVLTEAQLHERQGRVVLKEFGFPTDVPPEGVQVGVSQEEVDEIVKGNRGGGPNEIILQGNDAKAEIARLQGQAKALAEIIAQPKNVEERDRALREQKRVLGKLEFLGVMSRNGKESPVMFETQGLKIEDQKEFLQATPEQQESFGLNVLNVGHKVEEVKSRTFRGAANWIGGRFKNGSTMSKFFSGLGKHFEQKEEFARTGLREIDSAIKERGVAGAAKKGGVWQRVRDTGLLLGNVTKWGRNLSDALGLTVFLPTRWFMLGSQAAATGIGTAKEVRFENEEVRERNRIEDIEKAAEEAWAIYEQAMKNKGLDPDGERTGITGGELAAAYREKLPKDLIDRIAREPKEGIGLTLVDRLFRPHIEAKARGIQKKLDRVDNENLSLQEKAKKKQEILLRFGRSRMFHDFDRMLSEQGTMDALAAFGHMGERVAQGVVYGMMAETWTRLIYDRIADSFSALGEQPAPPGEITSAVNKEMVEGVVGGHAPAAHTFVDEHAAWSAAEHGGIGAEHIPLPPYSVQSGDSFYRIIAEKIPEFRDMGQGQMQNHAMANFLSKLSGQELESIGIKGGNPQVITPGESLNIGRLQELLHEKTVHGMNIVEEAARHYGASEAIDVSSQHASETALTDSSGWTETVEPIAPNVQEEAFQAKVDMIGRYTNDLIPQRDFEGHQALWNEASVKPASEFLTSAPITAEEVLLQKRMYSLSELTKLKPNGFENVQEFLQRAFEKYIDMTGTDPKKGEDIGAYLERATEAYLRTEPMFKLSLPR